MSVEEFFSSVSPKGQITLPSSIRRELGLKPKDRVVIQVEDGVITVKRVNDFRDFYQIVPPLARPLDWKEVEELAHDEHGEIAAREGSA